MLKIISVLLLLFVVVTLSAQSPSGIITYKRTTTFDSTSRHIFTAPGGLELDLPEEVITELLPESKQHTTRFLHFTPNTTWSYTLLDSLQEGKTVGSDITRSYMDSTYQHYQLADIGMYDFGGQETVRFINLPTQIRRIKRRSLDSYTQLDSTRQILGYTCQAYKNEEIHATVWVTKELELPGMLPTGFLAEESLDAGVVLALETPKSKSEAVKIEFCELSEAAIRHTPLLKLKPELVKQP